MQTFDQSLMQLWKDEPITFEEALGQASNAEDFALKARGIDSTSDSRWEDFDRDEEVGNEQIKVDRF
jgi:twitching motility protein PilT